MNGFGDNNRGLPHPAFGSRAVSLVDNQRNLASMNQDRSLTPSHSTGGGAVNMNFGPHSQVYNFVFSNPGDYNVSVAPRAAAVGFGSSLNNFQPNYFIGQEQLQPQRAEFPQAMNYFGSQSPAVTNTAAAGVGGFNVADRQLNVSTQTSLAAPSTPRPAQRGSHNRVNGVVGLETITENGSSEGQDVFWEGAYVRAHCRSPY